MYVVVDMYQLWHSLQPFLKWVSLIFLVLLYRLDDCSFFYYWVFKFIDFLRWVNGRFAIYATKSLICMYVCVYIYIYIYIYRYRVGLIDLFSS